MGSLYGTPVSARSSVAQIRRFGAAHPAMLVDGTGAHNGGSRVTATASDCDVALQPSGCERPCRLFARRTEWLRQRMGAQICQLWPYAFFWTRCPNLSAPRRRPRWQNSALAQVLWRRWPSRRMASRSSTAPVSASLHCLPRHAECGIGWQIGGLVPGRVRRIPLPQIERQEPGRRSFQLRQPSGTKQ
jgi:hypothetical protein